MQTCLKEKDMSSKTQKDLGDFLGILADDVGTKEFVEEYQF